LKVNINKISRWHVPSWFDGKNIQLLDNSKVSLAYRVRGITTCESLCYSIENVL